MAVQLNPYLHFRGQARQALQFYAEVLGGTPEMTTFGQFEMPVPDVDKDNLMHGFLRTEQGLTLMAADMPSTMEGEPTGGITLSMSGEGEDDARLSGYWDKLADGAQIDVPFEAAPWGAKFGQLTDKFGVPWMVNIQLEQVPG